MDNASPHVKAANSNKLYNIEIQFIPPGFISVLQPCDCGIIKSLKSHYWRLFLQLVESNHKECLSSSISIINVLFLIDESRKAVTAKTIQTVGERQV